MSSKSKKTESFAPGHGPVGETSPTRRRLLKGGVFAAPVLMTLPRIGSATALTSNQHCAEQKVGGLSMSEAVNPSVGGPYVVVARPTYQLQSTSITVVYAGPLDGTYASTECGSGDWHDITDWTSTYTANCSGGNVVSFTPQGGGAALNVVSTTPGSANLLVHAGTLGDGSSVAIGPAPSATYIFPGTAGSCWASAMPGLNLPQ